MSKWKILDPQIRAELQRNSDSSDVKIAKIILQQEKKTPDVDLLRTYIKRNRDRLSNKENHTENFETDTKINDYKPKKGGFTAIGTNGGIMNIETYCKHYNLDFEKVRSFKLVTHTAIPFYNIAFYESEIQEQDFDVIRELLEDELKKTYHYKSLQTANSDIDNLIIADLHIGAYIDSLINTKDYSIPILIDYLNDIVAKTNKRQSKEVNVLFLGDMIESFTGLNHKNSWKGLQKGMIGAEVIKFSVKILHEKLLSKINNLGVIKLVAGNHDRLTSDKAEDTDGGAADLIAFGLELLGYKIEFHPTVISTEIDNINYILLHGHKGISGKSTKDICWDYGKKGMFNVILEGHLHSIIQKLSAEKRKAFKTMKDDAIDHIRMNCRSLFTGNGYSEDLGYTSNAGFSIITNNGKGLPDIVNLLL